MKNGWQNLFTTKFKMKANIIYKKPFRVSAFLIAATTLMLAIAYEELSAPWVSFVSYVVSFNMIFLSLIPTNGLTSKSETTDSDIVLNSIVMVDLAKIAKIDISAMADALPAIPNKLLQTLTELILDGKSIRYLNAFIDLKLNNASMLFAVQQRRYGRNIILMMIPLTLSVFGFFVELSGLDPLLFHALLICSSLWITAFFSLMKLRQSQKNREQQLCAMLKVAVTAFYHQQESDYLEKQLIKLLSTGQKVEYFQLQYEQ